MKGKKIDFQYTDFELDELIKHKEKDKLQVGVIIPTRDESSTLGKTIEAVHNCGNLVDKLLVVDSSSTDNTIEICENYGTDYVVDEEFANSEQQPLARGKGYNMWVGTQKLAHFDIISYLDADIKNIKPRFIFGPIGPLIKNKDLIYVKGRYQRPESDNRLTRFTLEPMLSLYFPKVAKRIIQPLCGQSAGRTKFLKEVPFKSGYSIEADLLVRAILSYGPEKVGQVYLGKLENRKRSSSYLGKMATNIIYTILELHEEFKLDQTITDKLSNELIQKVSDDAITYTEERTTVGDKTLEPIKGMSH